MRAILVSVDYADLLAITLPYNRHHFSDVCVVTSPADHATQEIALHHSCALHITNAFYERGASFNKWAALEEGLDRFGRHGWLCLMDADVLWPKLILEGYLTSELEDHLFTRGNLYTPLRRMFSFPNWIGCIGRDRVPPEGSWHRYPLHRNIAEWAGYSQMFHADDPVLKICANCGMELARHWAPTAFCRDQMMGERFAWHQTNWTHAGGADSFFQERWPRERRVRPPFEVLHLGEAGVNWYGRASRRLDGTLPPQSQERLGQVAAIWRNRRGKSGEARFESEKL